MRPTAPPPCDTAAMARGATPTTTTGRRRRGTPPPTLTFERGMWEKGHHLVAGVDEVGRGAWAGPIVVGMVVLDDAVGRLPSGTRDSKLVSPEDRERLVPKLTSWCTAWSIGSASPAEIDAHGLAAALRLACQRALDAVAMRPDAILVDGNVDLFALDTARWDEGSLFAPPDLEARPPEVQTIVRGDRRSATIAAASILAKVTRDREMRSAAPAFPDYGFEHNVGYGTPEHARVVASRGLSPLHRASWSYVDRLGAPLTARRDGGRSRSRGREASA